MGLLPLTRLQLTRLRLGQIAHFAAAGHEIVAFDYVGCGRSPKPRDWYAYAFHELQADAAAVVATYGTSSSSKATKNVLVGHSAGCLLCLGLVAADSASGPQSPVAAVHAPVHGLVLMAPAYVPSYRPLPLFYLPARVLTWIQPKLDAGFEALALHESTTSPGLATEARKATLALAREVNPHPRPPPRPRPPPPPRPHPRPLPCPRRRHALSVISSQA